MIEDRDASDLGQLPRLLNTTVEHFMVKEVLADKIYNTVHNQEVIAAAGAEAFIPFKTTHTGRRGGLWKSAFSGIRSTGRNSCSTIISARTSRLRS